MDAKKLQQLQQVNAQKKLPLGYQTNIADYRTATHSTLFQQQQQSQVGGYQLHQSSMLGGTGYQQSPTTTSSSGGGGPLSPIDMQPQPNKLLLKHHLGGSAGNTSSSSHSSPYHQSYTSGEQVYQSPNERTYLAAAGRLASTSNHAVTSLQQQYQQLQQAKLQAQLQTQSEAAQQQQRTFALRQAMNPPVPGHYHMSQSSSIMSSITLQQQQQQQLQAQQQQQQSHQRAPPSTLNLASQFQPAAGPLKVNPNSQTQHYHQDQAQLYAQQQQQLQMQLQHQQQLQQHQQQQQRLKAELQQTPGSENSPVYIQQNHPGHVVNQACQTQISAVKSGTVVQKATPSPEDTYGKSPSHAPLDRKKSVGSIQALKSPITKRAPTSPVTLSGWLYKQGSDGLKVWRKRWFVLAEYCLYYYKGPEEEKLLGSILLPSYKVSACLPEDKIYRKFAFKCEHQNMRTYWLAAESAEAMVQWVRALTAAAMMQGPSSGESDQASQPSAASSLNHSGENSDSGIHTLQSQQSKMSQGQVTPASDSGNMNTATNNGGGAQPLYANAPPKPRRINDGGYSSPSPEHSIDNERKQHHQVSSRRSGIMSPTLQQMQQQQQYQLQQQQRSQQQPQQHHAIYDARTGNVSSALRLQQSQQKYSVDNMEAQFQQQLALAGEAGAGSYSNYMDMEEQILRLQQQQQQQRTVDDVYSERELYMQKLIQQRYAPYLTGYPNAERRTPDAYGRSKNRVFSDYEDIYNLAQSAGLGGLSAQEALLQEAASYRRPLSPPSYDGTKHVPPMPSRYTPNALEATTVGSSNSNLRARPSAGIMRPHSADFLEFEARAEAAAEIANTTSAALKPEAMRTPRPKSSLDINRTPDSVYYSEASYAEKMRKSALYLQHPQGQTAAGAQPQQAVGVYRTAASDFTSPTGTGMNTIGYENPYERAYKRNEMLHDAIGTQGAASMPRMSRSMGGKSMPSSSSSTTLRSASSHPQPQTLSPTQPKQPYFSPSMSTQQIIQQNEQFLRSASARLPKRTASMDDEYHGSLGTSNPTSPPSAPSLQDGERKREESMKRLLEWKQRMLQSPLTRKSVQQAGGSNMSAMSKLGSNPNILLASTTVASGAHYGPPAAGGGAGTAIVGGVSAIQRRRSESHANNGPAGYNSYSSDDEDGTNKKAPAGRSTSNTPTPSGDEATGSGCSSIKAAEVATTELTTNSNKTIAQDTDSNITTNSKKAPKFLKPILKIAQVKQSFDQEEAAKIECSLKLDVSHHAAHPEIPVDAVEVPPVAPENPAPPESPQITSYTPVYTTKLLSSTASKNYENVELYLQENKEVRAETPLCQQAEPIEKVTALDPVETPMLMHLKLYTEQQKCQKPIDSTESTSVDISKVADEPTDSHASHLSDCDNDDDDTACEEYTDDDLDEALAEDCDIKATAVSLNKIPTEITDDAECAQIYENERISSSGALEQLDESHYLPMTPKRSEFNQTSCLTLVTDSNNEDENPYVIMSKYLNEEDSRGNYEVMCISPHNDALKAVQHEPVYMELSSSQPAPPSEEPHSSSGKSTLKKSKKQTDTLKKKSKKSANERTQSKRKDLPDILKPSQSTLALASDSSDADDESSKHIDAKKLRSRSRFSLSDTFRPASYYLGASTPLANCAESSDSEIVSPPPIPASPPLLEVLNTEEIFSSEHYDTVKRRDSNNSSSKLNSSCEQISKIHASNTSLNLTKAGAALKSSRLSLPDQFTKVRGTKSSARQLNKPQTLLLKHHERTLSDSNYSFQTDNSSNTSSDFDLYNKLKQNSPSFIASPLRYQSSNSLTLRTGFNLGDSSETDSVEFRQRQGSDSELERQRSRRPLSEDSISEIELLSEKFEETSDLDSYLSHLQSSDCYLYQSKHEGLPLVPPAGTPNILIKPPEIFRNKNDEYFYGNIHFVSSTDSLQKLDNSALPAPTSTDQDQSKYYTPMHSRNNSNISEQSAPYYYSELDSSREILRSTPTSMTLNNQRDVHAHSSCNIAHIHNHIERPYLNVELLADKDQLIDSKNINEMKTNIEKLSYSSAKNLRSGEPFQQATTSKQAFHLQQLQNAQIKLSNFQTNLSTSHSNVALTPSNKSHVPTQTQHPNQAAVQTQKHVAIPPCPGTMSGLEPTTAGVISASTLVTGAKNTNVQMVYSENSRSGEGAGTDTVKTNDNAVNNSKPVSVVGAAPVSGELLWEEDTLWRESLRRVSQRHARSLDDLDRIATTSPLTRTPKGTKITREVTYVNENVSQHLRGNLKPRLKEAKEDAATEQNEHDVYVQLMASPDNNNSDVYEQLREDTSSVVSHKSSEIDRETIRQWDSMSSGLMKNPHNNPEAQPPNESSTNAGSTVKSLIQQINAAANDDDNGNNAKAPLQCAASISVQNVRNLPKGNLTVKPDPTDPQMQQLQYEQMQQQLAHSYYGTAQDTKYAKTTSLNDRNGAGCGYTNGFGAGNTDMATSTPLHPASNGGNYYAYDMQNGYGPTQHLQVAPYPLRRNGSRAEIDMLERETSSQIRNLDVSAGDLLSRTHEELVLLLIQLRRQSSNTARAIEQCCTDIHEVQNRLRSVDGLTRAESIQRLDYLKQHLLDLERQYEKSKPLVNLVDNMVKLGSLYRNNDVNGQQQRPEPATLDRLEYNQRIQERRMLQEEQKQWDRLSPNHAELQMKVNQLYHLDQLVQEESGSLQSLQRDKEYLERTLGGLRARLQDSNDPSMDVEAAKKQQHLLERELSRVHQLLAENSKELEHNVTRNAILEQELLVLRQKLQTSRETHGSQNPMMNGMESELKRVQTIVGDMQRQRQELSSAVRLLTENSNRLYQEIGNKENGVTGNGSSAKKRTNSNCWTETDLDSMQSINRSLGDSTMNLSTPLYVDTSNNSNENMLNGTNNSSKLSDYNASESLHNERSNGLEGNYRYNYGSDNIETSGVDSDGFTDTNPFANLTNQDKQEIKTVRIVKRESERRHRDRSERNGLSNSTQNLDQVLEEEQYANSINGTTNGSYQQTLNGGGYGEDYSSHVRSKSLPRTFTEPPKLRHHHNKQAASKPNSHYNGIPTTTNTPTATSGVRYGDYYGTSYDKNSNYAAQRHHSNGAGNGTREHLNPLANAYFAKQLQQQQQNRHSLSRDSAQTALRQKTDSMQSLNKSITDLSPGPVFQSEAARQIMNEMSAGSASEDTEKVVEKVPAQHKHRRAVPREKRRHYTAPNNVNQKAMENVQSESDMNRNNTNWRARDDLDMEVALRPRMNAPDVVRSALGHGEKISENTIDNLLLAPNKINIPERYIPEKTPELSPEEKKRRQEKVESIKKMLAEAPISTANDTVTLPPSKIDAERKQREHILDLNQQLAQQVMQMSKIVAERAMAKKQNGDDSADEDERESESPSDPLPLYQQRDNLFN